MTRVNHDEPDLIAHEVTYISCGLRVKGLLVRLIDASRQPPLLYLRGGIRSVGMVRLARMARLAGGGMSFSHRITEEMAVEKVEKTSPGRTVMTLITH